MSATLDKIRERYPQYADTEDGELVLRIGSKYPTYLDQDPSFKQEFQAAAGNASVSAAQRGVSTLMNVLGSPAAGEASEAGREQANQERVDTIQQGIDQPLKMTDRMTKTLTAGAEGSEMGREEATAERVATGVSAAIQGVDTLTKVLRSGAEGSEMGREQSKNEKANLEALAGLSPTQIMAKMRAGGTREAGQGAVAAFEWAGTPLARIIPDLDPAVLEKLMAFAGNSPDIRMLQERAAAGDKEAFNKLQNEPGKLLSPQARKLIHGVAGVEQSLAGTANFFTSPIGIATLGLGELPAAVQKLVSLAFTAQMVSQAPGIARELGDEVGKPESERDYGKIAKLTTDAITTTGFTAAGGLHLIAGEIPRAQVAARRYMTNRAVEAIRRLAPNTADALNEQIHFKQEGTEDESTRPPAGQENPPEEPMAGAAVPVTPGPLTPQGGAGGAQAGQVLERITGASYTHPETGEVTTGENHPEAAAKQGVQAPEEPTERHGPEFGFEIVDPKTGKRRVVSRDEAEAIARLNGQLLEEPKRGRLHSDEVDFQKGGSVTSPDQSLVNVRLAGADKLRDLVKTESGETQSYGSLDVPAKAGVLAHVLGMIQDNEVFKSIVPLIPVDVVNMLSSDQFPAKVLLHDKAMFADRLSSASESPVITPVMDSLVRLLTGPRAEGGLPSALGKLSLEDKAAVSAGKGKSDLGVSHDTASVTGSDSPSKPEAETTTAKIERVSKMTPEEFTKHAAESEGGFTADAYRTGAAITSPDDLHKLRAGSREISTTLRKLFKESKEAFAAGDTAKAFEILQKISTVASHNQWFHEAIEAATGASSDAGKVALIKSKVGENYKPPFENQPPQSPELIDDFAQYHKELKAHQEALAAWEAAQPANKPIIFQHENLTEAISPNVGPDAEKYPWRVTSFSNIDHMPMGHQTYATRLEAVKEASRNAVRVDKIPFDVQPLPIRAFPGDKVTYSPRGGEPVEVEFRGYSNEPGKAFIVDPTGKSGEVITVDSMELSKPTVKPVADAIQEDIAQVEQAKKEKDAKEAASPEAPAAAAPAPEPEGRSYRAINKELKATKENIRALKASVRDYKKVKDKGAVAAVEEKLRLAQNKLADLEGELSRAKRPTGQVGTVRRRFDVETERTGDDILSHIRDTGKLMSWTEFVKEGKRRGKEWFDKNKSLYDDIRGVTLPLHHAAAIYGGTQLPDTVADTAFREGKLPEGHERSLWEAIKSDSATRLSGKRKEVSGNTVLKTEEQLQVFHEATRQNEAGDRVEVSPEMMVTGDSYVIDGHPVKVIERDDATGSITLDGGEHFGTFKILQRDPVFYVDSIAEAAPSGDGDGFGDFPEPDPVVEDPKPEVPAEEPTIGVPNGTQVKHFTKRGGKWTYTDTGAPVTNLGLADLLEKDAGNQIPPPAAPKPTPKGATDLFGNPIEDPAAPAEHPELGNVERRDLTKAEQDEFQDLSIKARRAREENGPALTTEETKRYDYLTALAGQQELIAEDTTVAKKGRLASLRSKLTELKRQRDLAIQRAQDSYHRRDELIKEARVYEAQADEIEKQIHTLNQELPVADREFSDPNPPSAPRWEGKALTGQKMRLWGVARHSGSIPDWIIEFAGDSRERHTQEWVEAATGKLVGDLLTDGMKFKPGQRVMVGPEGGQREGEITGSGPFTDGVQHYFVRTNMGETAYPEHDIQASKVEAPPEPAAAAAPAPAPAPPEPQPLQKFRVGTNPQTYTLIERLAASEVEIANGEQPMRVKNDKTGREEIVMESDLTPVKERTKEERAASKPKDLDNELRMFGLDPDVFQNKQEKREALKRAKAKGQGPGSPSASQGPDPKAQIKQLEESFRNAKGRKLTLREQLAEAFSLGERISAARTAVGKGVAGFKAVGDYLIKKWSGYNQIDDLLKLKGELSAELEKRGWRVRQFVATVERNIPAKEQRAAIAKWVDAGGDLNRLQEGFNNAPAQYQQAYEDAMHLSGDLLVAAHNIRNFFDSRLQEAIDAGVLETGVEDYLHRLYEKDPTAANTLNNYVQSGILSANPRLAKKRVFDHDWEAERLGYKVVQDFLPRITAYESSLSRAIAAREFIRKAMDLTAKDGRPVIDVAGVGIPIENSSGVQESTLIRPSTTAATNPNDPMANRRDYNDTRRYPALRKWKWVSEDSAGNPVIVQGDLLIHPDFVSRIDALLKPSAIRYADNPKARMIGRAALGAGGVVKQTMLDLSMFHQVQIAVHAAEHRVLPQGINVPGFESVTRDIDFENPNVDGLMRGGVTLGGEYFPEQAAEGLIGRSLTQFIPGLSGVLKNYHSYLFQNFIPRVKMTMALEALERNKHAYRKELANGKLSMDDIFHMTANQANAAFGELNYTMLERSKTLQDAMRIVFLAPDFLEARGRFALQAATKHGKEQRVALALGAITMWTVARALNLALDGQMHNEPENLFSVVYKNKAYGLRTVQGDILHALTKPVQFWMSRLNPVYGRTLLEMASGRDYFGRKRSAMEQVWDFVSTAYPISLRTNAERGYMESIMNGFGITARRFNDTDTAFKMAQQGKDKNGIKMKGEFIYDADKDTLRGLKIALSNGDEGGATRELKKLLDSGKETRAKLNAYFARYANMPFTGSAANDRKFYNGLSEDGKKTVDAARQHKRGMLDLYRKARDKYEAALAEPTPAAQ